MGERWTRRRRRRRRPDRSRLVFEAVRRASRHQPQWRMLGDRFKAFHLRVDVAERQESTHAVERSVKQAAASR